jgi:hypothetical protein
VLIHFAPGDYRSLAAPGRPFSEGAVADPGFDLVHAVFARPPALQEGLDAARRHVEAAGRPVTAIVGFELRVPEPLSRDGFDAFNAPYVERLAAMGLASGGDMVTTRTNVAPVVAGIAEPAVFAFTYTVTGRSRAGAAYRLSGAAETRQAGSTADKLASIVEKLEERMAELGVGWVDATATCVYGPDATACGLDADTLRRLGPAALRGLTWYPSRPPVHGLELEMDVRGVGAELVL